MAILDVYWRMPDFDVEEQAKRERRITHTGWLSDEHDDATSDAPVLVEQRTDRVFRAGELPPETTLFIEDHPGPMPPLAEQARRAGFMIEHAINDPGLADRPRETRTDNGEDESGERRRERF